LRMAFSAYLRSLLCMSFSSAFTFQPGH